MTKDANIPRSPPNPLPRKSETCEILELTINGISENENPLLTSKLTIPSAACAAPAGVRTSNGVLASSGRLY